MDWGSFIPYCILLLWFSLYSARVHDLHRYVIRVEAKLSFLAFVESMRLEGKTEGEIAAKLTELGQAAKADMKFAEIMREESKPWWRKLGRRRTKITNG